MTEEQNKDHKQQPQRISKKREKQTRFLSQAIQLEESVNPHIIRSTMVMASLSIFAFLVWAGLTNINEVARTPGEVIPFGYQQIVQHLDGGSVKAIHVQEGEIVQKGQVLLTISEGGLGEDLKRAKSKELSLLAQIERNRAFVGEREPDFSQFVNMPEHMVSDQWTFYNGMKDAREKEERIIRNQIVQKKQNIAVLASDLETARSNYEIGKNLYDRRARLNRQGYTSDVQLLENLRQVNQIEGDIKRIKNQISVARTEIREFEERLKSLSARHKDEANEKLGQLLSDKEQNKEIIKKLEDRIAGLDIRAPAHGLVKGLTVNTLGSVVQPGQTIMEIVPIDKELEIAVKISPQDVGHLKIGQDVQVKFSSYDFSRYGSMEGRLDFISATTFTGNEGERYYQGRVVMEQTYLGDNPQNMIMPGMTVMADIITGEKTILQYILKPIHVSLKTAFRER